MTRTGIVQSVHAFGEDRGLAVMFAIFISAVVVVGFGLVIFIGCGAAIWIVFRFPSISNFAQKQKIIFIKQKLK